MTTHNCPSCFPEEVLHVAAITVALARGWQLVEFLESLLPQAARCVRYILIKAHETGSWTVAQERNGGRCGRDRWVVGFHRLWEHNGQLHLSVTGAPPCVHRLTRVH